MTEAQPWWAEGAIDYVDELLNEWVHEWNIFEWGSGGSTEWMAEKGHNVKSVEHDKGWHDKAIKKGLDVLLTPLDAGYPKVIERERKQFDLVVVDGRRRVECVNRAMVYVKPGGRLLLDDTQRERYKPAIKAMLNAGWREQTFKDTTCGRLTSIFQRRHLDPALPADESLPPFFIPSRDRHACLQDLVTWLVTHGLPWDKLHIIDNQSTFDPTLEMLYEFECQGANVTYLKKNIGARGLFTPGGPVEKVVGPSRRFFISDPDVVPAFSCRPNLLKHLTACMDRYTGFTKIGLSLETEDLPDHFPHKARVTKFESRYWKKRINTHLMAADTATTFCLVSKLSDCDHLGYVVKGDKARTTRPDVGIHTAWYLDPSDLPDDEKHYYENAPRRKPGVPEPGTSWTLKGGTWIA